jgi:hypothetical protein
VASYSPGPATIELPSGQRDHRWMTLSRHPGSRSVVRRSPDADRFTVRLFARGGHRRSRADGRPLLGPRSLVPPLFLERCVRAYSRPDAACRLLQLHLRRTGNPTRTLVSSRTWTMAATIFLFQRVTHDLPLRRAVTRGEPRIRPEGPIPVPVLPALRRFARPRYRTDRATSDLLRGRSYSAD